MGRVSRFLSKVVDAITFVRAHSQHLPLAFESIFSMPCTVALLQGTPRGGGQVVLLYVGRRRNYGYLLRTFFDRYRELSTQRTSLLTFRKHMDTMSPAADVVLLDLGWPYNGLFNKERTYLEIPDWVSMTMELPDTWEEVVRRFRQTTRNNDLRLIRRNGYTYRITRDLEAIKFFHDRMYLPFVTHKHAAESMTAPRRHVLRRARKGQLLQVVRGDELVAAGVIYHQRGVLYFLWMGVAPQFIASPPEGAISALYFFGIQYAFENKYSAVDFTGTRSFLNDGAFKFKRKWGALIEDTFSPSSLLIKPRNGSADAVRFCEQFPVLTRREEGLEALFVSSGGALDDAAILRLKKEYGCIGVDQLTVIRISAENATRSLPIAADGCQCRIISTTPDRFAECYVTRSTDMSSGVDSATAGVSDFGSSFTH